MAAAMTPAQKRSLLENGVVVLRSAVPLDAVERARELITSRIGDPSGRSDKGTNEVVSAVALSSAFAKRSQPDTCAADVHQRRLRRGARAAPAHRRGEQGGAHG